MTLFYYNRNYRIVVIRPPTARFLILRCTIIYSFTWLNIYTGFSKTFARAYIFKIVLKLYLF